MIGNTQLLNSINAFSSSEVDYHVITTDNKYMKALGLSSFSLSELYQWMSIKNSAGQFVNLRYIEGAKDPNLLGAANFLTMAYNDTQIINWMFFSQWQKKNRTGEYVKIRHSEWKYPHDLPIYNYSDIGDLSNWYDKSISFKNDEFTLTTITNSTPRGNGLNAHLSGLVNLNEISRLVPLTSWFYDLEDNEHKQYRAIHEFIMDIKSSQEKCIQWNSNITFNLWVNDFKCTSITDSVSFKLYLYDFTNMKNPNRTTVLNYENLYLGLPRQDTFNRLSLNDGTGEAIGPSDLENPTDPSINTIAKISLSVNPSDGKAYSGSPNILVRLTSNLPAAKWAETDYKGDITEEIKSDVAHSPGIGTAIPISEQNSNPLQWSSQYESLKCDPANASLNNPPVRTNFDRFTIEVQNHFNTNFPSGTMGYASKLMGQSLWSFVPIGTYETESILNSVPRNWSFTYLMMNFDNFFTSVNFNRFTAIGYEAAIYQKYYEGTVDFNGPYFSNTPLQISSWDFMGSNIGGTHPNGNALSVTLYGLNNNGETWGFLESTQGRYSTPFFGCVFPDGYNVASYNEYTSEEIGKFFTVKNSNPAPGFEFMKNVNNVSNIFDNSKNIAANRFGTNIDPNKEENYNLGIFVDGPFQRTLNHLPADIALNAAPSEDSTGAPLTNHKIIHDTFSTTGVLSGEINKILGKNGYVNRNVWMHSGTEESSSAFNFSPINPYKIQFRPLKHEIYDAFMKGDERGTFGNEAASYQKDNVAPINFDVLKRLGSDQKMLTDNKKGLRYNSSLINKDKLGPSRVPFVWWYDRSNLKFPWLKRGDSSSYGSGAIGVIGASCTVNLQKSITFDTNFLIGVRSSGGTVDTSFFSSITGIQGRRWYTSYGGNGNNYYSYNTTQLFVRIFQHWPKEYTIYDPAKFAVFHFNTEDPSLDFITYSNLNDNDKVYSNGVNNDNTILTEQINRSRYKKLLPYIYEIDKTIGIDISEVWIENNETNTTTITPTNFAVVINNQGSKYKQFDTFKITGGNGISPILTAIVNQNGNITGFNYAKVDDRGYNYKQSNFPSRNTDVKNAGGLQIVPVSVSGTGFIGRVVRGIGTSSPKLIDEKPKQIGQAFIQLIPDIPPVSESTSDIVEPFTGSNKVTVNISPDAISDDGLYDLFFHFHNDTSHTLISNYNIGLHPDPLEQFVDLTMSTN